MAIDPENTERAAESSPESASSVEKVERTVARGRAPGTPFVLLGGVAAVVWTAVALVSLAVLLTWWLV